MLTMRIYIDNLCTLAPMARPAIAAQSGSFVWASARAAVFFAQSAQRARPQRRRRTVVRVRPGSHAASAHSTTFVRSASPPHDD